VEECQVFASKAATVEGVRSHLERQGADDDFLRAVALAVAPSLEEDEASVSSRTDLIVRRWVLRNGDIEVLRSLTDAVVVTASASLLKQERALAALAGVVVALFRTLRALRGKGVVLRPLPLAVLVAVKQNDGISRERLGSLLRAEGEPAADDLDKELALLQGVALPDRTVVSLIQQDAGGGWHALA
jgi:hypothetical protein